MSLACSVPGMSDLATVFGSEIPKYRTDIGFLKYPDGSDFAEPLVVNEYEAYLYRGALICDLRAERRISDTGVAAVALTSTKSEFGSFYRVNNSSSIPFVSPAGVGLSEVLITGDPPFSVKLLEPGHLDLAFDEGLLPLASHALDLGGRVLFQRSVPSGELLLVLVDDAGKTVNRLTIRHDPDSDPIFRASHLFRNDAYLVYYDNVTLRNYLARFKIDELGVSQIGEPVTLPFLEDPAGLTYEMIPAVFLLPLVQGELGVVGGTFNGWFSPETGFSYERIDNCLRVLEAISTVDGPVVLCQRRDVGNKQSNFFLYGSKQLSLPEFKRDEVPYALQVENGRVTLDFATDSESYARMLRFDLERIQQNGWMEFGINNDEGRVPWSQIYYLNGMLDFLLIAQAKHQFPKEFSSLLTDMRSRLDVEMSLVDWHWRQGGYATRAFTVDRSPALFAVQTSRLVLLMERYLTELDNPIALQGYPQASEAMACLREHIELLRFGGEPVYWMKPNGANLHWPRGSAFYFDGLAVPYNHQNEWAYAVRRGPVAPSCTVSLQAGREMIDHFMRHVAPAGVFPNDGVWDYWWGTAYYGWEEDSGVSINQPSYGGDRIRAWISFRTIDLMSVLAYLDDFDELTKRNLVDSARHLVYNGYVYPFANYELLKQGHSALLSPDVALKYLRVSAPWELQSAAWAYLARLTRYK